MHNCYSHHSPCSKFDTLIQAQARELSHLRQRMREGRGVCHILTQHLGDTTKAFEELLRSNDIDYYMGQSFRDQLSQSISLAQRVSTKISGREWFMHTYPYTSDCISKCLSVTKVFHYFITTGDHSEVPDDKSGHELLAIRWVSWTFNWSHLVIIPLQNWIRFPFAVSISNQPEHVMSTAHGPYWFVEICFILTDCTDTNFHLNSQ